MIKFFKKLKLNLVLFFHGLFQGLRSADATMLSQVSGEDGDNQEISHKLEINSVYNDLLREHKTQEVLETIENFRVFVIFHGHFLDSNGRKFLFRTN